MKYFLLACACVLSVTAYADQEYRLDLKMLESQVLSYSNGQKAIEMERQAKGEQVSSKYSELLPRIDFSTELIKEYYPQSSLKIQEDIPYPPKWVYERKALKAEESILKSKKEVDRQTLLNTIRKLYYQIIFLEKKKSLLEKSLAIVQKFKSDSEKRYNKAYAPKADLNRAILSLLSIEKNLQDADAELESSKKQLLIKFGKDRGTLSLSSELVLNDKFLNIQESELRKNLQSQSSPSLRIDQLKADASRYQTEAFPYKYLPSFSLSALLPLNKETGAPLTDSLYGRPTYSVNINWNIFSGGADRFEQRRLLALKAAAEFERQDGLVNYASDSEKTLSTLLEGRNSYLKSREGLPLWDELVETSQRRFREGHISSKDMDDDIHRSLRYSTEFYEQTFEVIKNIADYCTLVGDETLFYDLML